MAASLFTIVLAAAAMGGGQTGAESAYNRCLDTEVEAAIARGVGRDAFVRGAPQVCADETAVYRRMAVASMVGQGMDGASPDAAGAKFDAFDRDNRAELISRFEQRMKLRRGPARITGLAPNRNKQRD